MITPHAVLALQNHTESIQRKVETGSLQTALCMLDVGTLCMDSSLTVMVADETAHQRLEPFGRIKPGSKLKFDRMHMNIRFREIIRDMLNTDRDMPATRMMKLLEDNSVTTILVMTKIPAQSRTDPREDNILVLVINPRRETALDSDWIAELFNFTSTEASLACKLASGATPEVAARDREVSINTIRSQIRSLYQKVGVSKQTDLIRVLLQSAVGCVQLSDEAQRRRC